MSLPQKVTMSTVTSENGTANISGCDVAYFSRSIIVSLFESLAFGRFVAEFVVLIQNLVVS